MAGLAWSKTPGITFTTRRTVYGCRMGKDSTYPTGTNFTLQRAGGLGKRRKRNMYVSFIGNNHHVYFRPTEGTKLGGVYGDGLLTYPVYKDCYTICYINSGCNVRLQ